MRAAEDDAIEFVKKWIIDCKIGTLTALVAMLKRRDQECIAATKPGGEPT
jgi:hypothetical protein